jgi:hypothetical protein
MGRQFLTYAATAILALGIAARARADDSATPPQASGDTAADQMLNEMLKPSSGSQQETATTQPSVETIYPAGQGPKITLSPLLREGSSVVDHRGHLKKVEGSAYPQFVFDNDGRSSNLAPMYVMPNLRLMQIEDAVNATRPGLSFTVSGQITEYRGNNYILLDSGPEDLSRQFFAGGLIAPTTQPQSADQMLNTMLSQSPSAPPTGAVPPTLPAKDSTSGSGAVAPGAPLLTVLREGSEIIDRTGRLTRSADGRRSEFTFDSDGAAMQDPPLIILPNLKLATMEDAAAGATHDLHFRITGIITEYRGRNCVLLEKVVVIPDSIQQF